MPTSQSSRAGNRCLRNQSWSQGNVYTGSGSESDLIVILSPKIHTSDIGDFAQIGFDQQVKQLAVLAGFQEKMVRDVYKHAGSFEEAKRIVKVMHKATVESARVEIEHLTADDED